MKSKNSHCDVCNCFASPGTNYVSFDFEQELLGLWRVLERADEILQHQELSLVDGFFEILKDNLDDLLSNFVNRDLVNSNFQLDVGRFTLNFSCNFEISN